MDKRDRQVQCLGIRAGDCQSLLRYITSEDLCIGTFFFQGESDCPAARPDIQNPGRIDVVEASGCFFHKFLRLGAWNEDAWSHVDSERKKVRVADDVLQRLACQAACQENIQLLLL